MSIGGGSGKPKTKAQLDREIEEALELASPISPTIKESLRGYAEGVGKRTKLRQKLLHKAMLEHQALFVTRSDGKRVLVIQSGEMSNPEEGAFRATEYWSDGPRGHTTRKSVMRLAQDLSYDLDPRKIEPASEAEVMAWMSTPEYEEGTKHVLEMQRRNSGR